MSEVKKLNGTLQENLLSLLAHSDTEGRVIVNMVVPQLFEGEYRTIAERCIDYWQRYGKAPNLHTADLLDDIISDKNNRRGKQLGRILTSMRDIYPDINTQYVMGALGTFVRAQRFKDGVLKSAEQLNSSEEIAVTEVEKIWNDLLRERVVIAEPATRLTDYKKLVAFIEKQYSEFILGIKPLDKAEIVPARQTVMLFLAAAKRGKSWFLVNTTAVNLMLRKKIVYFTLEMSEEQALQRIYQRLFSIAKDETEIVRRVMSRDDEGQLVGFDEEDVTLPFKLKSWELEMNLEAHVKQLGKRADNLRIKRFPTRRAKVSDLAAALDTMEISEGFIPDMIVLDYAGILKADPRNYRIEIGRNFEDFRALCIDRNCAGVTAGQLSRQGAEAMTAGSTTVAEDWSQIATADSVIVFSSTDAEKALGLGRMRVTNARDAEDNFGVLVTQDYKSGQFATDAIRLNSDYYGLLDDLKQANKIEDDDDPEYDNEEDEDR